MHLFLQVFLFLLLSNSPCFYLFLYITLEAGDSCDADGIITSEQQQHHSTETVYRGSKGIFIESSKIPVRQTKLIGLMYSQLPIVEDPWKNVNVFYIVFDL